jgi:phosphate:Na+ symporter
METFHHILKLSGCRSFAIYLLEESLKPFWKSFKLYNALQRMRLARRHGGAIVTGILQSSSMVSFMVLLCVGLGIYHEKCDGYHPGCKSGNNT